jgi:hypothetical protein
MPLIDSQAIITGINRPGDPAFESFQVHNGDHVSFAKYTPVSSDQGVGIMGGQRYNMFIITQPDRSQAFVVWSPDEPIWQDRLSTTNTVISGVGASGRNTLKRGDRVQVRVQDAERGGVDVTLDVFRERQPVATFSFVSQAPPAR